MAISKAKKHELRQQFAEKFNEVGSAIIANYSGLTMTQLSELRTSLREMDSTFKVIKNRVAKKALEDEAKEFGDLSEHLKGPVGVVFVKGDIAQVAKTVLKFEKDNKAFEVTGGVIDKNVVSLDEIKAISDLPSREELLAKIVGSIASPSRGLVTVLSGVSRNLVQVLGAIKDKKSA